MPHSAPTLLLFGIALLVTIPVTSASPPDQRPLTLIPHDSSPAGSRSSSGMWSFHAALGGATCPLAGSICHGVHASTVSNGGAVTLTGRGIPNSPNRNGTGGPMQASPPGSWLNLTDNWNGQSEAPTPSEIDAGAGVVFDVKDGYYVFCSVDEASDYPTHTWILHHGVWSEDRTPTQPPVTPQAAMTFDAADGYVILEVAVDESNISTTILVPYTWSFSDGIWTNRTLESSTTPPARYDAGLAFDAKDGYVVLFGGYAYCPPVTGGVCSFNDTWSYLNGVWTNISGGSSPRARSGFGMVYDPQGDDILLFGGFTSGGAEYDDWWVFSSGVWTQKTNLSATHPSPRGTAHLTDVPSVGVLLFGGSSGRYLNDTWSYSNGTWINLSGTLGGTSPGAHFPFAFERDSVDNFTLLMLDTSTSGSPSVLEYSLGPSALLFPSLSRSVIDLGQAFALNVSTVPAGLNLTFSDPGGCSVVSSGNLSCTPQTLGNFTVNASALGPSGFAAVVHVTVTVHPDPSVTDFGAVPSAVTVGTPTSLVATVTNGTPPYTYFYAGLPNTCTALNSSRLNCTAFSTGVYSVSLAVRDVVGEFAFANATLIVNPVPHSASLVVTPSLVDQGSAVSLVVSISGGTPPMSYVYSGLPPGCPNVNASAQVCTPTTQGNYSLLVVISDVDNVTARATAQLTVLPALTLATASVAPLLSEVGVGVSVHSAATGGAPPYAFVLAGFPGVCVIGSSANTTCYPSQAGSFSLDLVVTDRLGTEKAATFPLTVSPRLNLSSFSFSPAQVDVGGTASARLVVTGGVDPITLTFPAAVGAGLPCASVDYQVTCTPVQAGLLMVSARADDGLGVTAEISATLAVYPSPVITAFRASPNPSAPGASLLLSLSVEGGVGPFSVAFVGLPPGCAGTGSPNLTCTPSDSGTFTVRAQLVDAAGGRANSSVTLTVEPFLLGVPWFYVVASGGALVALAVVAFVLWRRRSRLVPAPEERAQGEGS